MELIKAEDGHNPICPHCDKALTQIVAKQFDPRSGWLNKQTEKGEYKFLYSCPNCEKVLGVGQSDPGYEMG